MNLTVADLSESELLARIFPHLDSNEFVDLGPGDDCAVVTAPGGKFVVSTDVLVQDVHFKTQWSSGFEVGWRAAMQNLSDIGAMGAIPSTLVVGLAMPPATEVAWMEDFARGLAAASRQFGAAVVGGDLSSAPALFISVTVHGHMTAGIPPVLRSGAKPGDVVAHCGLLGWSAAGLRSLLAEKDSNPNTSQDNSGTANPDAPAPTTLTEGAAGSQLDRRESARHLFRTPLPPVSTGALAARAGAHALMDVSDSLLRDAGRMGRASGVVLELDAEAIAAHGNALPQPYAGSHWLNKLGLPAVLGDLPAQSEADAMALKLTGGEDHGLLATFSPDAELPAGFVAIGTVLEAVADDERPHLRGGGVTVSGFDAGGLGEGWDHFR